MKTGAAFAASTVGLAAFAILSVVIRSRPPLADAPSADSSASGTGRTLLSYEYESDGSTKTWSFDECVGMHIADCREWIKARVEPNPGLFKLRAYWLEFKGAKIREVSDVEYNVVQVRTDEQTGEYAAGITGDGLIWYPFQWSDPDPRQIGPWDCAPAGELLTVEDCCTLITSQVTTTDVMGNRLMCGPSFAVRSPQNPYDRRRVIVQVDANNIVVRPPKTE